MGDPQAAYVHVPFCRHRCGYCNFTLVAGRDDLIGPYLDAVELELRQLHTPRPVETLFFGGGTPTHMADADLARLFHQVTTWFPPVDRAEISIEANPSDLTEAKIELLVDLGVTRVSLGAQSWHAAKLEVLERDHDAHVLDRVCGSLRDRVASLSVDLIFGVPGESRDVWRQDLDHVLSLRPDHVSTYGLTFERGTRFWSRRLRRELVALPEDEERWMYEFAIDALQDAGWEHYEVSNFARPGHRCRHNEVYWRGQSYYAVGPGAARYVDGWRETNHRSTTTYLNRMLSGRSPVAERERLSDTDRAREMLVLGLRRLQGIDLQEFAKETGHDAMELGAAPLEKFQRLGLLTQHEGKLRLTRAGLMVSDSLWPELL